MTRKFLKIWVLFNGRAGSAGQIGALREALAGHPDATLVELRPDDDLGEHVARAAATHDIVAVAGGDGTVHRAVNGLVAAGSGATLAVLPLGTGNDFCRTMAVPLDPVEAVELFRTGAARSVDIVRLGGDRTGVMVNAATGGFSGKVAADVTPELKAAWGPLAYLRGAAGVIADLPRYTLTVRLDGGQPETFDALNVVVANARTAGGGTAVAPRANPEDGLLDIVIVRYGDALDLSVVAARLMQGDYLGDENVVHRLARKVELKADVTLPLSVDGELCEGTHFTFEVVPRALRVLTGPGYHAAPEPEAPLDPEAEATPVDGTQAIGPRPSGLPGSARLVVKRAQPGYLVGLGVIVAGLLFAWLARGVAGGEWRAWDDRVGTAVRGGGELTGVATAATLLGDAGPFAALVIVAVLAFLAKRRYSDAAGLLVVVVGVLALEGVLKPLFAVARPVLLEPRSAAQGYSFPSGHALRAIGLFGYLAGVAMGGGRRVWWRVVLAGLCVGLAAAICWSRVYLGVHYPTDILAGALAAGTWVAISLAGRHYAMKRLKVTAVVKSGVRG